MGAPGSGCWSPRRLPSDGLAGGIARYPAAVVGGRVGEGAEVAESEKSTLALAGLLHQGTSKARWPPSVQQKKIGATWRRFLDGGGLLRRVARPGGDSAWRPGWLASSPTEGFTAAPSALPLDVHTAVDFFGEMAPVKRRRPGSSSSVAWPGFSARCRGA